MYCIQPRPWRQRGCADLGTTGWIVQVWRYHFSPTLLTSSLCTVQQGGLHQNNMSHVEQRMTVGVSRHAPSDLLGCGPYISCDVPLI